MTSAQHDPYVPVKTTLAIIDELLALMAEEEKVLRDQDFARHKSISDRKQRLFLDYSNNYKAVTSQKEMLKSMPLELKRSLRDAEHKIAVVGERNLRLLRSAIQGTENLLKSIVGIVRAEAITTPWYSNPKTKHLELGKNHAKSPSVAASKLV